MSITTTDTASLPIFLALEVRRIPIISVWLNVQSLVILDIAVSSNSARKQWLITLEYITCNVIDGWFHSHSSMRWVIRRGIRSSQILVARNHGDKLSDVSFEAAGINCNVGSCDGEVRREGILSIWEGCKFIKSIDLKKYQGITDIGISALAHGCHQLERINLSLCEGITDISVSALGHGCHQLQTIDLFRCQGITDVGVSALGHGCHHLQMINLSDCQGITDVGVSALGHGCGQLQTINISRCQHITDVGLSALGDGCCQLQTIDLSGCQGVTDMGASALSLQGCRVYM